MPVSLSLRPCTLRAELRHPVAWLASYVEQFCTITFRSCHPLLHCPSSNSKSSNVCLQPGVQMLSRIASQLGAGPGGLKWNASSRFEQRWPGFRNRLIAGLEKLRRLVFQKPQSVQNACSMLPPVLAPCLDALGTSTIPTLYAQLSRARSPSPLSYSVTSVRRSLTIFGWARICRYKMMQRWHAKLKEGWVCEGACFAQTPGK